MKTLVFGLGNPILSDDGIGMRIAQELRNRLHSVDVKEGAIAGLSILDEIQGYDRLIIIDSIKSEKGRPGQLYKLKLEELNTTMHLTSSHGMGLATTVELGKQMGYKLPGDVEIYAIEIENNTVFSENCTARVKESIPRIVDKIIAESFGDSEKQEERK